MNIISRQEAKRLGLKHYWTGKTCPSGHVCYRLTCNTHCVECQYLAHKQWVDNNREHKQAYDKEYQKINSEKISDYNRQRYLDNREWFLHQFEQYRRENPEYFKVYNKQYRKQNHDRCLAQTREWQIINKERFEATKARRRAAKLKRMPCWLNEVDDEVIAGIYTEARGLTELTEVKHVVDHVIPLQGKMVSGLHVPNNLNVVTSFDNASKYNNFDQDTASDAYFRWLKDNGL